MLSQRMNLWRVMMNAVCCLIKMDKDHPSITGFIYGIWKVAAMRAEVKTSKDAHLYHGHSNVLERPATND